MNALEGCPAERWQNGNADAEDVTVDQAPQPIADVTCPVAKAENPTGAVTENVAMPVAVSHEVDTTDGTKGLKFAVQVWPPFTVRLVVYRLPVQAPLQPVKVEFVLSTTVSETVVPLAKLAEQAMPPFPQLIPAGVDVMRPVPKPVT